MIIEVAYMIFNTSNPFFTINVVGKEILSTDEKRFKF
jgi:hypothetical protein